MKNDESNLLSGGIFRNPPVLGRFLQPDVVADTRDAQGMNAYMYVNGNPVRYRDPAGRNAHIDMLKEIVKHMAGGFKWAAKNVQGVSDRIAQGKNYNQSTNSVDVLSRKVGEFGTFTRRFFTNAEFAYGTLVGGLDYITSLIANGFGKNEPYITYHNGGFVIHNSIFPDLFSDGRSFVIGATGHLTSEASKGVLKHEVGHIDQFLNGGINVSDALYNEVEYNNDLRSFTFNYSLSSYLFQSILPPEVYNVVYMMNVYYDPVVELKRILLDSRSADPLNNIEHLIILIIVDNQ